MNAVLIISHGSRAPQVEETFASIVAMVRTKLPEMLVDSACMQLSDSTVPKAVARLAANNATTVKVVPYFLFTGMHIQSDIPQLIAELAEQYPDISFTIGQTLGVDERLADILVDRIKG
ncbi:MAG: CbiX/SirB N-terminal domain-containing protein [Coriobacteriales bacterium]|jgi:sirohydrochlorin ferrochelatase|nr:CbiX/SirB N-terminal domain-containing protein [Coriobacteriales bacterium]